MQGGEGVKMLIFKIVDFGISFINNDIYQCVHYIIFAQLYNP